MQMPARGEEVWQPRPAHERGEQAAPLADLLDRRAEEHDCVGGREPANGTEAELHLARPPLVLHRARMQANGSQAVANGLQGAGNAVEPHLGQVLVATLPDAHGWRRGREPGVFWRQVIAVHLDDVVLDLDAREVVVASFGQLTQHLAHETAAIKRHWLAVAKIGVAEHPAGAISPWQDLERGGIGYQHDVGEPGEFVDAKTATCHERRHEYLIAAVQAVDRAGEVQAVAHGGDRHVRGERFGARHSVLVDDDQADGTQFELADPVCEGFGCRRLLAGVQAVPGDESGLAYSVDVGRNTAGHLANLRSGGPPRRWLICSSSAAEKLAGSTSARDKKVSVRCTPLIWKIWLISSSRKCA